MCVCVYYSCIYGYGCVCVYERALVCACVSLCVRMCMRACAIACARVCVCLCGCVSMPACACLRVYLCLYLCQCLCLRVCLCVTVCVCEYDCVCACTLACVRMRVHVLYICNMWLYIHYLYLFKWQTFFKVVYYVIFAYKLRLQLVTLISSNWKLVYFSSTVKCNVVYLSEHYGLNNTGHRFRCRKLNLPFISSI